MKHRLNKWLFMIISTTVTMLYVGLEAQFGSLFLVLLDTFNRDRSSTVTIQSLLTGVTVGFGVVSGTLITKFGLHRVTLLSSILVPLGFFLSFFATRIEHLYVTIGLISGIGNSMGYVSTIVVASRVFSGSQLAFCLAFQSTSIAFAALIFPYIIDLLISLYALRGTFLVLSAILCNAFPFFIICWINKEALNDLTLTSHSDNGDESQNAFVEGERKKNVFERVRKTLQSGISNLKSLIDKRTYLIVLVASGITVSSLNGYLGLVLDISKWKGFNYNQGLLSFVFFSISNGLARLLTGILKQKKGISIFLFSIFSCLCGCISGLLFYFGTNYVAYVAAICLTGIAHGGIVTSITIISVKIVPKRQVAVAIGLQFTIIGIFSTGIGPMFGKFRDMSGSYNSVVLTIAAIQITGCLLFGLALLRRRREVWVGLDHFRLQVNQCLFKMYISIIYVKVLRTVSKYLKYMEERKVHGEIATTL